MNKKDKPNKGAYTYQVTIESVGGPRVITTQAKNPSQAAANVMHDEKVGRVISVT
ncbi:MAG: hypothetical protein ACYTEQ_00880 [Planctomycetota bacterium]|jgi:hypothetical protein